MNKAESIQQQMQSVRREFSNDVEGLVAEAKSLVDWRDQFRAHPWVALGIAAVVGYALVPKRNKIVQADPDMVAKLMNSGKIVMAPNGEVKQRRPWAGAVLTTLAGVALRSAAGQLGHQVAAQFTQAVDPPESSQTA